MNWKKILLIAAVVAGFGFASVPRSEAGVRVGIGINAPLGFGYYDGYARPYYPYGYGYPPFGYYAPPYGRVYRSYYWHNGRRYYHTRHNRYHR